MKTGGDDIASEVSEPPMAALLGIPFHATTMEGALADVRRAMLSGAAPQYYVTANVDFCRQASRDPWLRDFIFHADRVFCDGLPLVWLSKFLGAPLPERVAGSDMVPKLLELCASVDRSVFWFGSDPVTLERAAKVAVERFPGLSIAGFESPPMGDVDSWDHEATAERIKAAAPDLLLVALGCPKQERWIARHYRDLGVPLSIGIGASLDFIAGKQVRAPRWMRRVGLEWFWRAARSPRRLAGRYAKDFLYLLGAAFRQWRVQRRDAELESVRSMWPREGAALVWEGAVVWERRSAIPGWDVAAIEPGEDIAVDAAGVTRIDAAGLGRLAALARSAAREGVRFALLRPSRAVRRAVRAMGFDALLDDLPGRGAR
jgi:N-acetylglucosaminyldiphosphoundecaprenol N-acetyl-beta-D-mannosaminyltransferase